MLATIETAILKALDTLLSKLPKRNSSTPQWPPNPLNNIFWTLIRRRVEKDLEVIKPIREVLLTIAKKTGHPTATRIKAIKNLGNKDTILLLHSGITFKNKCNLELFQNIMETPGTISQKDASQEVQQAAKRATDFLTSETVSFLFGEHNQGTPAA